MTLGIIQNLRNIETHVYRIISIKHMISIEAKYSSGRRSLEFELDLYQTMAEIIMPINEQNNLSFHNIIIVLMMLNATNCLAI